METAIIVPLCVVKRKIINALAGDRTIAHETGCEFVRKVANVKAIPADIAITSNGGYPLDQNTYQSVKRMTAAESMVEVDWVIENPTSY